MNVQVRSIAGTLALLFVSLLWLGAPFASAAQDVPSNAHPNTTGKGWECDRGYVRTVNECRPVILPRNASLDYTGHRWECNRGYARAGDECRFVLVPANASIDYTGHRWECNRGYARVGEECRLVIMPANASIDYTGHRWECNRGYARAGDECRPVAIPVNASIDYTGHRWECDRGYVRTPSGDECQPVVIPANASIDYTGHRWECNRGYVRAGDGCRLLVVPANASLDYTGHRWACNRGYVLVNSECRSPIMADSANSGVAAAHPKAEDFSGTPTPASAPVVMTNVQAPTEPSLSQPADQAVPDVSPTVSKPTLSVRSATAPNPEPAPRAPSKNDPTAVIASNSPAYAAPNHPARPVVPRATDSRRNNSFLILAAIFLVFGLLRLTRIVRP